MSRKGKSPIKLPQGVTWSLNGRELVVKGPKGTLTQELPGEFQFEESEQYLFVKANDKDSIGAKHGLVRSLLQNMITGTSEGFKKKLELVGVGFRAAVASGHVDLQLGFSHPTKVQIPEGIQVEIEKSVLITISGIDKQVVGQFAADIRALKKPEPYKGKGIRYADEYVRRKAGKTSKK